MAFKLPPLPYAFDALEPYIDALTMEIHYTKHHQAYVNNLNTALEPYPELEKKDLRELITHIDTLPDAVQTAVRNNAGGDFNHSLFWPMMKKNGGGQPNGLVADEIKKHFGAFDAMKDQFTATAKSVFGSGWAWLCVDKEGKLLITSSKDQDSTISRGLEPILGLDVWEHAYYLKYQNRRPDYIAAWWHVINWETVEEHYRQVIK